MIFVGSGKWIGYDACCSHEQTFDNQDGSQKDYHLPSSLRLPVISLAHGASVVECFQIKACPLSCPLLRILSPLPMHLVAPLHLANVLFRIKIDETGISHAHRNLDDQSRV